MFQYKLDGKKSNTAEIDVCPWAWAAWAGDGRIYSDIGRGAEWVWGQI